VKLCTPNVLTYQNSTPEEIKSRLKSRNACYYSLQNFFLSVCYLKIEILKYREIQFCLFFCGCETWSLTVREEHRLRVLENRMLVRIFWPKGDKVTGEWKNCIRGTE